MSDIHRRSLRDVIERQFDVLDANGNIPFLHAMEGEPFRLSHSAGMDQVWFPSTLDPHEPKEVLEGLLTSVETSTEAKAWFVITATSSLRNMFVPFLVDVLLLARELEMPHAFDLVLDDCRELWKGKRGRLGMEQQRGLMGELYVLHHLLSHQSRATLSWEGPLRALHDFSSSKGHLEIKTTTTQPPSVRISQVGQVAPLEGDSFLELIVVLLEPNGPTSLPSLVEACRSSIQDIDAQDHFENVLRKSGYRDEHAGFYHTKYTVIDVKKHRITKSSPVLKASVLSKVPATVRDITYTLDVFAMDTTSVQDLDWRMYAEILSR